MWEKFKVHFHNATNLWCQPSRNVVLFHPAGPHIVTSGCCVQLTDIETGQQHQQVTRAHAVPGLHRTGVCRTLQQLGRLVHNGTFNTWTHCARAGELRHCNMMRTESKHHQNTSSQPYLYVKKVHHGMTGNVQTATACNIAALYSTRLTLLISTNCPALPTTCTRIYEICQVTVSYITVSTKTARSY